MTWHGAMPTRRARKVLLASAAVGVVASLSWAPPAANARAAPDATARDHGMGLSPRPTEGVTHPGPLADESRTLARDREPVFLSIPDLGVESEVVTTGMDATLSIVVPDDVLVTAWYDGSRRLGAPLGSTVIVGHRDSATQGTGALYGVEELPLGASITVNDRGGARHNFTVTSVELIDKAHLPAEAARIFSRTGSYRLVLITCGGDFDEAARSYLSNVVITALPASAARY